MGWLGPVLGAIAAWLFYRSSHVVLMWLAILSAVGCFWSWGVMHNYAVEAAKRRKSYTGGFSDFTDSEVDSVPDGITRVDMVLTFLAIGLFIASLFL